MYKEAVVAHLKYNVNTCLTRLKKIIKNFNFSIQAIIKKKDFLIAK